MKKTTFLSNNFLRDEYDDASMIENEVTSAKLVSQLRKIIRHKRHYYMLKITQKKKAQNGGMK